MINKTINEKEIAEVVEIIKQLDSTDAAMLMFGAKILLIKKEMEKTQQEDNLVITKQ